MHTTETRPRATILLFALLCVVLLCCSGGNDKLWLPGLSLPKDSVVVTQQEYLKLEGKLTKFPLQTRADKILAVSFDNPHGWAAVTAHIDLFLNDAGYTDSMYRLETIFGKTKTGEVNAPDGWQDFTGSRMYVKKKSKFVVLLMNMATYREMSGQLNVDKSASDKGTTEGAYYLAVVQMGLPLHDAPADEKDPDAPVGASPSGN